MALMYIVGILASVVVQRHRAGLSQGGRISLATMVMSSQWFVTSMVKMVGWPVVLGLWLAQGRPESPWVSTYSSTGTLRVIRSR